MVLIPELLEFRLAIKYLRKLSNIDIYIYIDKQDKHNIDIDKAISQSPPATAVK